MNVGISQEACSPPGQNHLCSWTETRRPPLPPPSSTCCPLPPQGRLMRRPEPALGVSPGRGGKGPALHFPYSIHLGVKHILFPHVWGQGAAPPGLLPPPVCFPAGVSRSPHGRGWLLCPGPQPSKNPEWKASWEGHWPAKEGFWMGDPTHFELPLLAEGL